MQESGSLGVRPNIPPPSPPCPSHTPIPSANQAVVSTVGAGVRPDLGSDRSGREIVAGEELADSKECCSFQKKRARAGSDRQPCTPPVPAGLRAGSTTICPSPARARWAQQLASHTPNWPSPESGLCHETSTATCSSLVLALLAATSPWRAPNYWQQPLSVRYMVGEGMGGRMARQPPARALASRATPTPVALCSVPFDLKNGLTERWKTSANSGRPPGLSPDAVERAARSGFAIAY